MTKDHALKARIRAYQDTAETTYTIARERIQRLDALMVDHDQLCHNGIGVYAWMSKPVAVRNAELVAGRNELRDSAVQIFEIAAWMQGHLSPIKAPSVGSYTLKHVAERALDSYVANGELIAAALLIGYPHRYDGIGSPNVSFGISTRDLKQVKADLAAARR